MTENEREEETTTAPETTEVFYFAPMNQTPGIAGIPPQGGMAPLGGVPVPFLSGAALPHVAAENEAREPRCDDLEKDEEEIKTVVRNLG